MTTSSTTPGAALAHEWLKVLDDRSEYKDDGQTWATLTARMKLVNDTIAFLQAESSPSSADMLERLTAFVESTINFRIRGMTEELGGEDIHDEHLRIRIDEDKAILGVLRSFKGWNLKTAEMKTDSKAKPNSMNCPLNKNPGHDWNTCERCGPTSREPLTAKPSEVAPAKIATYLLAHCESHDPDSFRIEHQYVLDVVEALKALAKSSPTSADMLERLEVAFRAIEKQIVSDEAHLQNAEALNSPDTVSDVYFYNGELSGLRIARAHFMNATADTNIKSKAKGSK